MRRDRSHAQPPLGGEHGEDPRFATDRARRHAWSGHRGARTLFRLRELELTKPDLPTEARMQISNDLRFVSDLIDETSESLPTGQDLEVDAN